MKKRISWSGLCALVLVLIVNGGWAQQESTAAIDVQHYRIDAELIPSSQLLRAKAEVTFVPQSDTRSAVFELNGSLSVKRIAHKGGSLPAGSNVSAARPAARDQRKRSERAVPTQEAGAERSDQDPGALQFIQDNRENMNVRVDLGRVVPAKQPVTLVFDYEGALESPQGGPIQNARLAYVGEQGSYLYYAARWFPFHEYAADRATFLINLTVPRGTLVAGYSEQPVTPVASAKGDLSTFSFSSQRPVLPGNFAAAKYLTRPYNFGGFTVEVFFKAGSEKWADHTAEIVGKHLEYYSSKFGAYSYGNRLVVAETDEETLPVYSGPGMIFVSPRAATTGFDEALARETAFQWWGLSVGLKSFDDVLLSQGLAEFSRLMYVKDNTNQSQFDGALQAELERALAFEQSSSIRNAPKQLDDQSPSFRSVVLYKGAFVFIMLRQLMGDEKFDRMLRDYYTKFNGQNISLDAFETFAAQAAGRSLRFFFGQWIDSTGVPEFRVEYRILRNKDGFRVTGTVKQELDTFEMPIDILLRTETGQERQTMVMKGTSVDFDLQGKSKPVEVVVDPDNKLLRSSEELRQGVIVRRGIEHYREQEYIEAEQQFQAAIKLNRQLSWAWYNLGTLYLMQRNYQKALDAFDMALNGNLRPDWIEVWSYIYRGNAWDALDQRARAIAEYNKAISNGSNYDNAQAVAQAYISQPFDPKKKSQTVSESQAN